MGMGVSASSGLRWQGWVVGMVCLSGLLVFAPLGLYVWASGGPADPSRPAAAPPEVRVTGCRIDPPSRRAVAVLEARGEGSYVATVEFRDRPPAQPDARESRTLVRLPGLTPTTPAARTEAVGPVWATGAGVWCGVAGVVGEAGEG
ncbi:hypothetical protein QEZ40_002113 [Streptomyces katrae]|uniref:Uncharacterized protein n=1 Tax=Streptomyces katrae TaxID=68223 RepID=A0ABT7GV27_9ACTN|nr:hypothetical protein [Streptomyces katrae]MDK9497454.1 hypothetical protein [Streptomyces katrae]